MEQILAVLTLYLATVCLGTVAGKTAPRRLIFGGTEDRNVMSGKREETAVIFSRRSNGGTSTILPQNTAFSHRKKEQAAFATQLIKQTPKIIAHGLFGRCCLATSESRETSAMFLGS